MKYFVVLDFEATCDDLDAPSPQEIIEFPSVLVDGASMKVISEFHKYVKPIHHPTLRSFCTELTGIEQHQVDESNTFPSIFQEHQEWLVSNGLDCSESVSDCTWTFVTCGDWDLGTMLPTQMKACKPEIKEIPSCYRRWINIKTPFRETMDLPATGMAGMLKSLSLSLDGRHHSGIDDSRNIAKILNALNAQKPVDCITTQTSLSRYPKITINVQWRGETKEMLLKKRAVATLIGTACGMYKSQIRCCYTMPERVELLCDDDLRGLKEGASLLLE